MSGAFADAAGFSTGEVALLLAGVGATAVLFWAGWALLSAWYGWTRTHVKTEQFERAGVRIILVAVVILWILI